MANVHLSPAARDDLAEIRRYITEELQNPIAAERTVRRIFKSLRLLEQFPFSGAPLYAAGTDTGYRSVISGNYRSFYRCDEKDVYVIRVLYGRRDHMRILFGPIPPDEDEEDL